MSGLRRRRVFAVLPDATSVNARIVGVRAEPPRGDGGPQPYVVTASGVVDLASVGDLQKNLYSLVRAGKVRLIVDLSRVRLCDAAAMSVLTQVSRHCAERGGWLRLAHPVGLVAKVFDIVSLGRDVEIYPTVPAAHTGAVDDRIMR